MILKQLSGRHGNKRRRISLVSALESRRLLSALVEGPDDCGGDALAEAFARNGADHPLSWYAPAREVTVDATESDPTFSVNAAGLPLLTSRPDGQGLKLFLDFDGNGANLPFGIDADDTTFNAAEQLAIYDTWRDVMSYFSPFNVNVTTVQPPTGGTPFAWHLTSKSISGGYAFVNSLTTSAPTGFNQASDAQTRHSGIAHELGHITGLWHQGEWDKLGVNVTEYTEGFSVRDIAIMGVDYGTNVRTWIYGRISNGADQLQNDIAVIATKVASVVGGDGFRPDDYGNDLAGAYVMPASGGQLNAFLERYSDADVFKISPTTAGPWHIDATPAYESAASAKIELLDASGNVIASRDDADQRNQRNNDVEFSINLEPGTYYVRVTSSGDFSELGEYTLTAGQLPDGFVSADISTTIDRGGTASFDVGTGKLTQLGAGSDIFGAGDQFRYTYDTLSGDGSITARVLSIDNTDPSAKAGLMIRSTTANNSAFVMVSIKPSGQIEFITRAGTSGSALVAASATPLPEFRWLRLTRSSNDFTAAYSDNGTTWTTLGTSTIALPTTTLMGFATTSHNTRKAAYSEFDQIALTGARGEAAPTYNALAAPGAVTAAPASGASTGVVLNWADVSGETAYAIERSPDGVNFTRLGAAIAANANTYTDPLTFGAMRWWYRVVALVGSTSSAPSTVVSVVNKPSAVAAPSPAYATTSIAAPTGTALYLNWADVQGDAGYRIERSTNGSTFTPIATTATNINAYNDTTAQPSTGYVYRITPLTSTGDGVAPAFTFEAGTRWTTSGFKTTSRSNNSVTLSWTDFAGETAYRIERTTNGVTGWATAATLPADQTTWSNTSLSELAEYYYRVVADLPVSEVISSAIAFTATLPTTPLPTGWTDTDVGSVGGWGIAGSTNGGTTYKVVGAGTDVGGSADAFHYLYRPLDGDGSITVRVDSQKSNDIDDNAEAGIMIRDGLASNAKYAFINVEPGRNGRTDFEYRATTGNSPANVTGTTTRAPIWMRLTRTGPTITAEYSTNGSTWTLISSQTISMSTQVLIGMAVSAIEPNLLSYANYSNVSFTGNTSANQKPTILSPAFATNSAVTGTSTALSVVAGDDAGEANLSYTWSAVSAPAGVSLPNFSTGNGTNAGKNTTATFAGAGSYTLRVVVSDSGGLISSSDIAVNVISTLTSLGIAPANSTIAPGGTTTFTATGLDQFGNAMSSPAVNWSANAGSITSGGAFTAPAVAGPVTISAAAGSVNGSTAVTVNLVSTVPQFDRNVSPHSLTFSFNGSVDTSLATDDFVLTNLTSGLVIPSSSLALQTSGTLTSVVLRYVPGVLPDGRYQLTAASAGISLPSGQTLSAPITSNFAFMLGDVNGSNTVDFDDLLTLSQNYGQSGRTYSQGDLDYSGTVDFDDLLKLAQRYGTSLPSLTKSKNVSTRLSAALLE